jgi:DNA-binding CsgD family transcriptional regulator
MSTTDVHQPRRQLSARQRDVLALIAIGCTDREIADRLGIAPRTVRMHCDALKAKFAVGRRRDLLRFVHDELTERFNG